MLRWQVWVIALFIVMADQRDFQLLSLGMRRIGWVRFWIQTILGVVVVGVLLFNNVGSSLARNSVSIGLRTRFVSYYIGIHFIVI